MGFAVNVDLFAATLSGCAVCHSGSRAVTETSAACLVCTMGVVSGDLDVTSGTEFVFVVKAFCSTACQNCHNRDLLVI